VTAEAPQSATGTTPKRKRPIVLHWVAEPWMVDEFPQFDPIPGRGLCGFVFKSSNRVTLVERATEGEVNCGRCEELYLEITWACS
jgi:hypothetical protein